MLSRMLRRHNFKNLLCCLAMGCSASFSTTVLAATNHWSGASCQAGGVGNCRFSNAQNWLEQSKPKNDGSFDLVFATAVAQSPQVDGAWNVKSILFDTAAAAFVLLGDNPSGSFLTNQAGIVNNSSNPQRLGQSGNGVYIVLGAAQTWFANTADLFIDAGANSFLNNGNTLTIAGNANTTISPGMYGSGALIKEGPGTLFLGGFQNTNFTGAITVNQGKVQINGQQPIARASGVTLNAGVTLIANLTLAIGSTNVPMTFSGGTLQAFGPNPIPFEPSDFYGTLIIADNNSTIELAPADTFHATNTFAAGSRTGNGSVTINGWTGGRGSSGTDDQVFITAAPNADFLNHINFGALPPGAARLASGELVPVPDAAIWNGGGGVDTSWSTPANWAGMTPPLNNGATLVVFNGTTGLGPTTDSNWDILGINYTANSGPFANGGSSQLTVRSHGITNNGTAAQTIGNNIIMAAPQVWNAAAGPLILSGANDNGGFTLTIDGGFRVSFGGSLIGPGGLVLKGKIETPVHNVFNNQNITFTGGTFSSLNTTQSLGILTLAANSVINLQAGGGAGVLTFSGGSRTGGFLTISNWTGTAGTTGTDDRIFITSDPGFAFLNAIQFDGFATGGARLPSGEIVPAQYATWNGASPTDSNWSTTANWVNGIAPENVATAHGMARVLFAGTTHLSPNIDVPWDVTGITFASSAGPFINGGSQLTIRDGGIVNSSANLETFANNIVVGAPQTWNAASGPLAFSGSNYNAGFTLTFDGGTNVTFSGGLSGSGDLTKKGGGTLAINTPLTFAGTISLNSGTLLPAANNVLINQNITFNGGTFSATTNSQNLGNLTLAANSSSILSLGAGQAVLTFASGTTNGGTLTITGWNGISGQPGGINTDKIFITANPDPALLSAITFAGHPAGAMRLASGEIVPGLTATWTGGGGDNNWTTAANWAGGVAPFNGVFPLPPIYQIIFNNATRLTPVTGIPWQIQGITYAANAGAFINTGSDITTGASGIVNNSGKTQIISNNIVMAAAQTWNAAANPLLLAGANDNGGFTLTIDGGSRVTLGSVSPSGSSGGLIGSGGLIKNGGGTLTANTPLSFSGPIFLNAGKIETAVNNVFNGQRITFNGGTLSGLSSSQTFGTATLSGNSTINLDPAPSTNNPPGLGTLTFSGGIWTGGTLTINGWTGTAGQPGADDKIIFTQDPGPEFLAAIRFPGFSRGAVRLPSTGEIVPPLYFTWTGYGADGNWSTPTNWLGNVPPLNNGSATVVFNEGLKQPVTDLAWNILNLTYGATNRSYINSGSPLTISSNGLAIVNNGPAQQTISNNIVLGADQIWKAAAGPLTFSGFITNGAFTLTIDGGTNVTFNGGLTGNGGLTKTGTGILRINNTNQPFTGPITLNNGKLQPNFDNVLSGQNITFNGGTLTALNKSQTLGALTLAANSTISLSGSGGVLTFSSATVGGGSLTISGWSGVGGTSGTGDKIIVIATPPPSFLNAVRFTGFADAPAVYLPAPNNEIVPPIPPPPQATLSGAKRLSDTQFQFTINGAVVGRSYTVQLSTDLINWASIATVTASSVTFDYVNISATGDIGFYRVLSNP